MFPLQGNPEHYPAPEPLFDRYSELFAAFTETVALLETKYDIPESPEVQRYSEAQSDKKVTAEMKTQFSETAPAPVVPQSDEVNSYQANAESEPVAEARAKVFEAFKADN